MHYIKKIFARELRKNQTCEEEKVWDSLRNRKYKNLKFRRQHIIEGFIVDFYCHELKLAIEIDGKVHEKQKDYDELRELLIKEKGFTFIRVSNEEVNNRYNDLNIYNLRFDLIFLIIICVIVGISFIYQNNFFIIQKEIAELFLSGFFIWRILTIMFIKFNEIFSHQFTGARYLSFNRTTISLLVNLTEIIIGYTFLYTSFNVFKDSKRDLAAIFKTLYIFSNWITKDEVVLPSLQQFMVLSQVFVFIVLILVFLTALPAFRFTRERQQ